MSDGKENRYQKFSVLMSVYYKEDPVFFYDAVNSVFENTIPPDDVVIVVDGPIPEGITDVILALREKYELNIVYLSENVGLGRALNIGINYCKYNIIMRMDTDDYCINTRFQEQLDFFSTHSDVVLLGGDIAEFDTELSNFIGVRHVAYTCQSIRDMAKKRNPFNHMTVAFKKDIILSVGGYKHHPFMEDYNLWLRVIAKGHKVANLPKVMVNVRAGESMLSRRKGIRYIYSEYVLYKLKLSLGIDSLVHGFFIFLMRAFIRVIPIGMISIL
ncbi:TPA: glycosyltransferase, partial [Escherichia coli]|nr:glycosyltransferase [Escherichia coli]HBM8311788.1 glycosyltransferase [Escherichia coli]